jgi:small subunit ribosomal protein S8
MTLSDPIADFLTRIRNGLKAQHRYIDLPWSKMKQAIAEVLVNCGLVENILVKQETNGSSTMRVFLKYSQGKEPVIQGLKRVSKPGLRRYVGHADIPKFYGGFGIAIVSTSQGVIAGSEAEKRKIGGELLCLVW